MCSYLNFTLTALGAINEELLIGFLYSIAALRVDYNDEMKNQKGLQKMKQSELAKDLFC